MVCPTEKKYLMIVSVLKHSHPSALGYGSPGRALDPSPIYGSTALPSNSIRCRGMNSPLGTDFIDMGYEAGWISTEFNWTTWNSTEEGERLLADPNEIATADVDQLMKLMTAIVQVDRFMEGALGGYFDNGTVLAIVERAESILRSGESVSGKLKHYTWERSTALPSPG